MEKALHELQEHIKPLRKQLTEHPFYREISNIQELRRFMEHHIYAVWDFMSLLKALQRELTCVQVPWLPKGDAETRWLINEIVVGEESDIDEHGQRYSHFELYLKAMEQCGADTTGIHALIQSLQAGTPVLNAIRQSAVPVAAAEFMHHTFSVINSGKPHIIAAVFTFGREDLIPDLFSGLVNELSKSFPGQLNILQYYLERHIEVDGGEHGHLAHKMLANLCEQDPQKWAEARNAAAEALEKRLQLWDAIRNSVAGLSVTIDC